jgi:hypothetical protein
MQSYLVCAELGAVLGAGIHARMGALPGAGSSLVAGGGCLGILTGSMRSQVPESSLSVNPSFGRCGQLSPGQHAHQSWL